MRWIFFTRKDDQNTARQKALNAVHLEILLCIAMLMFETHTYVYAHTHTHIDLHLRLYTPLSPFVPDPTPHPLALARSL